MELKSADADTPDMKNWLAVMNAFGQPSDPRDTFSQAGYLSARVVTDALLKIDPAKIDRKSVTAALRNVKRFESDIWCDPWYVGDGSRHNPNHAGPVAIVKDGKFVTKPECIESEDPELADIRAYEKTIGLGK